MSETGTCSASPSFLVTKSECKGSLKWNSSPASSFCKSANRVPIMVSDGYSARFSAYETQPLKSRAFIAAAPTGLMEETAPTQARYVHDAIDRVTSNVMK